MSFHTNTALIIYKGPTANDVAREITADAGFLPNSTNGLKMHKHICHKTSFQRKWSLHNTTVTLVRDNQNASNVFPHLN
jgi:hypothetical protein